MVEVHDKVEDVGAFWRYLSHNDPASMPCCACEVVGVEFLALHEGVEYGLDLELVDCRTGKRSVRALRRKHGVCREELREELRLS